MLRVGTQIFCLFFAALSLGAVGYGVALIYALFGAPDPSLHSSGVDPAADHDSTPVGTGRYSRT